jgi:hypothetical protein
MYSFNSEKTINFVDTASAKFLVRGYIVRHLSRQLAHFYVSSHACITNVCFISTPGWTVQGLNLGGGEIVRTRPDQTWDPPSHLYNGYRVSFPGVKQPGLGIDHPPPSSAEVKARVELYLYSLSGPSWPVLW